MNEEELNLHEKELANERLRRYRCENLFWRLWGLSCEVVERIAEEVWGVETDWLSRSSSQSDADSFVQKKGLTTS